MLDYERTHEERTLADATTIARDQLKSIVERVERLHEERDALSADLSDVYQEAKANGFDTRTLKAVVKLRRKDAATRAEEESLLDLYMGALGMVPSTDAAAHEGRAEAPKAA